ncbi:MAG: hypothetical protein J6D13_09890 [Clostridium sp.]|nr:hypothetical protein [Clostridium sp.]
MRDDFETLRSTVVIALMAAGLLIINVILMPVWIIRWLSRHAAELLAALLLIGLITAGMWAMG